MTQLNVRHPCKSAIAESVRLTAAVADGRPFHPGACKPAPQRLCCLSSVLPWFLVPEHSIEDGEKLAGDCDEGNHLGLTEGEQVLIEGPQHVVATDCGHCRHEDGRANGCATAGDHAFALPLAGLLGERCDPDQAGDPAGVAFAPLAYIGQEHPGGGAAA